MKQNLYIYLFDSTSSLKPFEKVVDEKRMIKQNKKNYQSMKKLNCYFKLHNLCSNIIYSINISNTFYDFNGLTKKKVNVTITMILSLQNFANRRKFNIKKNLNYF